MGSNTKLTNLPKFIEILQLRLYLIILHLQTTNQTSQLQPQAKSTQWLSPIRQRPPWPRDASRRPSPRRRRRKLRRLALALPVRHALERSQPVQRLLQRSEVIAMDTTRWQR